MTLHQTAVSAALEISHRGQIRIHPAWKKLFAWKFKKDRGTFRPVSLMKNLFMIAGNFTFRSCF
jgi:hypothetical protein